MGLCTFLILDLIDIAFLLQVKAAVALHKNELWFDMNEKESRYFVTLLTWSKSLMCEGSINEAINNSEIIDFMK